MEVDPCLCFYLLDDQHNLIPTEDTQRWGDWMRSTDRSVAKTIIPHQQEDIMISTVFLAIPHPWKFGVERDDIALFETMVFGPEEIVIALSKIAEQHTNSIMADLLGICDIQERYATWDEAERGHERMCRFVAIALPKITR